VTGLVGQHPGLGGVAWDYGQYVLGLLLYAGGGENTWSGLQGADPIPVPIQPAVITFYEAAATCPLLASVRASVALVGSARGVRIRGASVSTGIRLTSPGYTYGRDTLSTNRWRTEPSRARALSAQCLAAMRISCRRQSSKAAWSSISLTTSAVKQCGQPSVRA